MTEGTPRRPRIALCSRGDSDSGGDEDGVLSLILDHNEKEADRKRRDKLGKEGGEESPRQQTSRQGTAEQVPATVRSSPLSGEPITSSEGLSRKGVPSSPRMRPRAAASSVGTTRGSSEDPPATPAAAAADRCVHQEGAAPEPPEVSCAASATAVACKPTMLPPARRPRGRHTFKWVPSLAFHLPRSCIWCCWQPLIRIEGVYLHGQHGSNFCDKQRAICDRPLFLVLYHGLSRRHG